MTMLNRRVRAERPWRASRRRWTMMLVASCTWTVGLAGLAPAVTADDMRSRQWYLDDMQAKAMWQVSTGSGVKVAIIDSGVNAETASLRGQVLPGKDFAGASGDETDDYMGHGTTMAELIAGSGKNGGLQGLAPGAKIIPFRVELSDMKAKSHNKVDRVDDAIRAAADSDAKIINMSFGGNLTTIDEYEAIKYAANKGKLLMASNGNEGGGKNEKNYPAAYPDVAGIASIAESGEVSETSTHGDYTTLSAPGTSLPRWCDSSFKSYCDGDGGTSSASAIASASAALIWSKHPKWTANQVLRVLIETAGRKAKSDSASKYIGYGAVRPRINLLEGKGDPGDPNHSPLYTKPTKSPSPNPSDPADGKGKSESGAKAGDKASVAADKEDSGNGLLWGVVGGGVAVVVVAAGAFVFLRRRRA
ncbi:S8 family serine peptidase [Streptomyces sp. NPDC000151]|uniref:S8 family serine peptidase n=1 Tax=Streptomyces sp. NPDC000151 TaxID=3154244 RepID=UPI00332AB171